MLKWTVLLVIIVLVMAGVYYYFPEDKLPAGRKIDKLVVIKHKRVLKVYSGGEVIKTYPVALGRNPVGDKEYEGDKRTPEGVYIINGKNPGSGYHKNLGISYPNAADRTEAKRKNLDPGGEVKIHGLKNGRGYIGRFHRFTDWTAGCVALTDEEIDELYANVAIGTPIIIKP